MLSRGRWPITVALPVLQSHGVTEPGHFRSANEDCFAFNDDLQLMVVADGMGGHNAGEIAARLAVDSIVEFVRDRRAPPLFEELWPFGFNPSLSAAANRIRTAIHLADQRILEASMNGHAYAGMGTTVVAALVGEGRLAVGHVGDSRLYLVSNSELRPLTRDDAWTASVLASDPTIDPLVVRHHPMRNALTNVVGTKPGALAHVTETMLTTGDVIALVTDGVHGVLDDRWLSRILSGGGDVRAMAEDLVESAIARGSRDNCTAVVARYLA